MTEEEKEYHNSMIEARLEGEQCNNDIEAQIQWEKKQELINNNIKEVDFQLDNIKGYLSIQDQESAKIKCKYLIDAVKKLEQSMQ